MQSHDPSVYQHLTALLKQRTGLTPSDTRTADVLRALSGDADDPQLIQARLDALTTLPTTAPLWQQILAQVTVGETYFFRNGPHFNALERHILPPLIAARRRSGQRYLRIWSAGCATGEELYSVAMLLREMIPDVDDWSLTLLGTDINTEALAAAQRGVYRARAFRTETRPLIRERWFRQAEDESYHLDPRVRAMAQFKPLNLREDDYPAYASNTMNHDIILCRNVSIYFSREQTQALVVRLHAALQSGGWLIVGHSEPQAKVYDAFETHILEGATFYRKPTLHQQLGVPLPRTMPPRIAEQPRVQRDQAATRNQPVVAPARHQPKPTTMPTPTATHHLWEHARAAANAERWDEALALLADLETLDRLQVGIYYLRAMVWLHHGDLPRARESLRQAVYCDPQCALAHYSLGDLYRQQGQINEARRHWTQALKALDGQDPDAQVRLDEGLSVAALRELLGYQLKAHTPQQESRLT